MDSAVEKFGIREVQTYKVKLLRSHSHSPIHLHPRAQLAKVWFECTRQKLHVGVFIFHRETKILE